MARKGVNREKSRFQTEIVDRIEGIGPSYGSRLSKVGIETLNEFRAMDVASVHEKSKISVRLLSQWKAMAQLQIVSGIDRQISEVLVKKAGIMNLKMLREADPRNVLKTIELARTPKEAYNIIPDSYRRLITLQDVKLWQMIQTRITFTSFPMCAGEPGLLTVKLEAYYDYGSFGEWKGLGGKPVKVCIKDSCKDETTNFLGQVAYTTHFLRGEYSVKASFAGDETYRECSSEIVLIVKGRDTRISCYGLRVYLGKIKLMAKLEVYVLGQWAILERKLVHFYVDGELVGSVITSLDGTATLEYSIPVSYDSYDPTKHCYHACFEGDTIYEPSSSPEASIDVCIRTYATGTVKLEGTNDWSGVEITVDGELPEGSQTKAVSSSNGYYRFSPLPAEIDIAFTYKKENYGEQKQTWRLGYTPITEDGVYTRNILPTITLKPLKKHHGRRLLSNSLNLSQST